MNYEEKYKEALERSRRLHDRMLVLSSTDALVASAELEFIFPELAESDERIRKELKEAFEAYDIESSWNGIPIRSIFAWLEKQKEQKPVEWSEEDEEMLEYVIGDLNDAKQLFHAKDAIDLCDKEIAWLKSLRPHWKPSEEQMKALEAATVRYQSTGLESLYENLKKL